jgi:hypothetical protein
MNKNNGKEPQNPIQHRNPEFTIVLDIKFYAADQILGRFSIKGTKD